MKILLTGANGFLGYYLCDLLTNAGLDVLATSRGLCRLPFAARHHFSYVSLDFTDRERTLQVVAAHAPDWIVHAGAMGKPDDCVTQPALATHINVTGTRHLIEAAQQCQSKFCYVSTDFVFDGVEGNYTEDAARKPVNHYGQTKLEAEELVERSSLRWAIVRTVLVYGRPMTGRSNLLSIVKEKLSQGQTYQVVDDQIRTPTYVGDLAEGIHRIITRSATGVFHISGQEVLTPYDMATRAAAYLQMDTSLIVRTHTASFQQPAQRPLKTGLCIDKAKRELAFSPHSFEEGLRLTFGEQGA
ncbi:MAG: SDR family oxidoreductase [Sphingomonadales bacterium]